MTPELSQAEVFRSIRVKGAKSWIPRLEHPNIPRRPDLWPTPPLSAIFLPPPPASHLYLNPLLQHRSTGVPPLVFDLSLTEWVIHFPSSGPVSQRSGENLSDDVFFPDGPHGSQPATYPGVCELFIVALSEDPRPKFLWPMIVRSHHESLPVTVRDVIRTCIKNFEQHIWQKEFGTFSRAQQEQLVTAYWNRHDRLAARGIFIKDDGLQRHHYLGERTWFRGLEPAPDGVGFMLFVGPPI